LIEVGGIQLYMGPTALGAPDDLEAVVKTFIDDAEESLFVAVQEIDSRVIAEAIIAARQRGVNVKVILEGDYLWEEKARAEPWVEYAGTTSHEDNRRIMNAFLRARINVISDLNDKIFHQKFMVRDAGYDRAAVLTGSTNFTLTDTGKNPGGNNLNHIVILEGTSAVKQYQAEFDRLRSGTFGDLHERVEPRPDEFRLGKVRVKPLFAPRHGPEMEIMKQMLKAKKSIDFAMFTFSNSSGIDDAMLRLATSVPKIRIRGVLDRVQGAAEWAPVPALKAAGVELFTNAVGNGVRKIHHKLMVIDEQLVIVGSFNYTEPANTANDENIVVLGDLEEDNVEARANQSTLATFALTEIERIITDLSTPVQ
jgi:phosphatidylserine/phosphatidylglycerophosphate/cardiolipin synthase-like enzyme